MGHSVHLNVDITASGCLSRVKSKPQTFFVLPCMLLHDTIHDIRMEYTMYVYVLLAVEGEVCVIRKATCECATG